MHRQNQLKSPRFKTVSMEDLIDTALIYFNIEDNLVPQPIDSVNRKTHIRLSDVQFLEDDVRKKLMKLREDKAPGAIAYAC